MAEERLILLGAVISLILICGCLCMTSPDVNTATSTTVTETSSTTTSTESTSTTTISTTTTSTTTSTTSTSTTTSTTLCGGYHQKPCADGKCTHKQYEVNKAGICAPCAIKYPSSVSFGKGNEMWCNKTYS